MRSNSLSLMLLFVFAVFAQPLFGETKDFDLYNHDNIVAWCIVPFDSKKRGPEERAAMLKELGVKRLAYDYRAEHVPTFDDELNALKENGIELTAWWFPGALNDEAKMTLELFKRHNVHPQLWISGGGGPANSPEEQQQRVNAEAARLKPIAEAAAEVGCKVALYNHGGWFGGPENQIEIIKELNLNNVGIVYNLHHGHEHLDRFEALLQEMKPYLLALNLNGMVPEGDQHGQKIVPLGAGELDLQLLSIIAKSGWQGPIGILDHDTSVDTRLRLQDNLNGLDWLVKQLKGETAGPRPEYQSWTSPFKVSESTSSDPSVYDQTLVAQYVKSASEQGNAEAGLAIFTSAKSACISCHKLGEHGGTVGPELTKIGVERKPREIVESIFWPKKDVKPEYVSHTIITDEGKIHTGYLTNSTGEERTLKNPATGELTTFAVDEIDEQIPGSTLMPDGLTTAMSKQQQLDLIKFVSTLGTNEAVSLDKVGEMMARMHVHGPAEFEYNRDPLFPTDWPNWQAHINRDRLYDFYAKEAEHFRQEKSVPHLLPEFPGLDGGEFGHWGNQTEQSWADDRWNETKLGSVQSGIFHHGDLTIPRAVCVQLGEENELSVCFDTDTLSYPVVWKDGFVKFSSVRHGFMHGLLLDGTLFASHQPVPPAIQYKYLGFFRHGKQVVFHFRVGDQEYYDIPRLISGTFGRTTILADQVSKSDLAYLLEPGELQWPQILETPITKGAGSPYVVDDIAIPFENPWNALFFCGGHDFLPDGRALVCTMQGDVWLVDGFQNGGTRAKWKRFASGLHHSLGLVVHEGAIYVQGRDQITRLYDHNNDGEADQYECFSKAYTTSSAGHDFICGLQRDADGNFYTASGNEGLLRISPDGEKVEVLATGFRNPDGLGLTPDGLLTVPCSEGEWTPSSMICGIRRRPGSKTENENSIPFFGYKKLARHDQSVEEPPALPLVYLPRGLDNSSGGQTYINSDQWGPLQGEVLHFSYGTGSHFLLLRDEVNGQLQGGVVPLPGEFLSGAHRGRFHPLDGQLYVTGMAGWGNYALQDGSFQRVRYTGERVQLPKRFHVFQNGILVEFTEEIDKGLAEQAGSHFAQCWNYRYSQAYGSPEYSPSHFGTKGHDVLEIRSSHVLAQNKLLFLEIPELQPVNQLHLRLHVGEHTQQSQAGIDLFLTVHQLDEPFTKFPGYQPHTKTIAAHPILLDMALSTKKIPNPWEQPVPNARQIVLRTGKNLSYETRSLTVKAGEMLELKLVNPDVVPHNWALVQPGALKEVGELANKLIADPEAVVRQYIPQNDKVIAYTDIVPPQEEMSIFFKAPEQPGQYPFLCTFPGHWMVMNGVMTVE